MRQGYIDPVVSKENTISTGPPGGGAPSVLAFFGAGGSVLSSKWALVCLPFLPTALFAVGDSMADRGGEGHRISTEVLHRFLVR